MNSNVHIPDDLLARYVAGETTPDETRQVKAWLGQSAGYEEELLRFQKIWEAAEIIKPVAEVNVDAAWKKVSSRFTVQPAINDSEVTIQNQLPFTTHKNDDAVRPLRSGKSPSNFRFWRAAASILIVMGLGWLGYRFFEKANEPAIANVLKTQQKTTEQTLPDGTKVFLNQNTTLSFTDDFGQDTRTVVLKGEAYFDVKRDENRPFIIQANGTEVKVLGTSFNVRAYDQKVNVAVTSGKVQFSTPRAKTLLVKNETATAQADTIIKLPVVDLNAMAYRTKVFVFDKTNLGDVVASLREGYQTDIQLSGRLKNCQLTARFERESLDATLSVIAETLHLQVTRKGQTILLDGQGCP
ncbi:iron dicitrate transport regulator FecR [Runella rosea]|uniref:Iron dicitrate transport regulator FecR n=1 Tax=Runella rosea TaxID=2259595 RepID=A0A344TM48_9BACT|nr:FecR domain-containing protein [Runella rosea]AXE19719.1 iron dicitrate transport regulator FecR [Runella rosea]